MNRDQVLKRLRLIVDEWGPLSAEPDGSIDDPLLDELEELLSQAAEEQDQPRVPGIGLRTDLGEMSVELHRVDLKCYLTDDNRYELPDRVYRLMMQEVKVYRAKISVDSHYPGIVFWDGCFFALKHVDHERGVGVYYESIVEGLIPSTEELVGETVWPPMDEEEVGSP